MGFGRRNSTHACLVHSNYMHSQVQVIDMRTGVPSTALAIDELPYKVFGHATVVMTIQVRTVSRTSSHIHMV